MKKENMLMTAIRIIVACKLNRSTVTWEEVQSLYDSGEYPEINREIDYILSGK